MVRHIRTGGGLGVPSSLPYLRPSATRQPAKATPLAGGYRALSEKAPQATFPIEATFSNRLGERLPEGLGDPLAAALARAVRLHHPQDFEAYRAAMNPHRTR